MWLYIFSVPLFREDMTRDINKEEHLTWCEKMMAENEVLMMAFYSQTHRV